MKTIDVPRDAKAINELLAQAHEEDLIVRDTAGREFMVLAIDDFDKEIIAARKNQALMEFLDERAKETETIPIEEVRKQLGL